MLKLNLVFCSLLLICIAATFISAMKRKSPSTDSIAHHESKASSTSGNEKKKFATIAVHVGSEPDSVTGAVVPPISLATTYAQKGLGQLNGLNDVNSYGKGFEYSRTGNPTRGNFERAIAAVERGKHGIAFSSGLSATNAILSTLQTNDHVICIDDVYGGTQRLFRRISNPASNIQYDFVDMSNDNWLSKIKPSTKVIWIETPTNPTLKITDIKHIVQKVKIDLDRSDIWIVVDNTFMSPYLQNPLLLGADIVVHSVTKYIGGHSDVVMGAIVVDNESIHDKIRFIQNAVGAVPSPFDCYMALRGLKTLHLRMEASQKNAIQIATYLESHTKIDKVIYPGLKSHPQYNIASIQATGYGAMITFFIKGGITEASTFLANLKLFTLAESLGAVESLAESPAVMTHASVPIEQRQLLGISDNLIRLSIGIEDVDDLIRDLQQALSTD